MAKAKRYNGGDGSVTEGENANIDNDTRARALKWVQEQADKGSEDEGSGEKTVSRSTKSSVSSKPASGRGASADDETGRSRGRPAEGEPRTTMGATRARTREEVQAAIPTGGKKGAGPTPGNGNSVDSTELGRNLGALANASGPGKLVTGLSLAAREGMAANAAQKAYNARASMRRAEEGLNATEAAEKVAKTARATREAKTLNPNAWLAGPKGMKENFKKGGMVGSASRRADGIATRGKTNCKMR